MHELSLCESLMKIVEEQGRSQGFAKVHVVRLEIGELSSVEPEAMIFCFSAVTRGTIAEGARLDIERAPGQAWCLACNKSVAVAERYAPCPECGGYDIRITGGEQMRIKDLEVD